MPLLQFRCTQCGHKFDALIRLESIKDATCPECRAPAQRLYEGVCNKPAPAASAPACPGGAGGSCPTCPYGAH